MYHLKQKLSGTPSDPYHTGSLTWKEHVPQINLFSFRIGRWFKIANILTLQMLFYR